MVSVAECLDKAVVMLTDYSIVPQLEFTCLGHTYIVAIDVSMIELVSLPLTKYFSQTA